MIPGPPLGLGSRVTSNTTVSCVMKSTDFLVSSGRLESTDSELYSLDSTGTVRVRAPEANGISEEPTSFSRCLGTCL